MFPPAWEFWRKFTQTSFNLRSTSHKNQNSVKSVYKEAVKACLHLAVRRPSHIRWTDEPSVEPNARPANANSCSILWKSSAKDFCCYLIIGFLLLISNLTWQIHCSEAVFPADRWECEYLLSPWICAAPGWALCFLLFKWNIQELLQGTDLKHSLVLIHAYFRVL